MGLKDNILSIKEDFDKTDATMPEFVKSKLDRSLMTYKKNIDKNINYLLFCRSSQKVKKYVERKYLNDKHSR